MSKRFASPATTVAASEAIDHGGRLIGRSVDRPLTGMLDGDLVIVGWALAPDGPLAAAVVCAGDRVLARTRADRPRPDIATTFIDIPHAQDSGFRMRIPLATPGELVIHVERAGGEQIPIWRLSLSGAADAAADRPRRFARRREQPGDAGPVAVADPGDGAPRVIALISAFNEADIIGTVIDHLAGQGVASYLIDDGSTDETAAIAQHRLGCGLIGTERRERAADGTTSWRAILARKLELADELGADWYIHHDADEIRESPWPGVSLVDAIAAVDRLGYNAIDFRALNFPPTDDCFRAGCDPRTHFIRWEDPAEYDRLQRKCWKAGAADVALEDGGHDIRFSGRRLFPLRFLLRHYPIRGQAHGARKVLDERHGRFAAAEVEMGWHRQYAGVEGPGHAFLRNPASLRSFDLDAVRLETALEDGRERAEAAGSAPAPDGPAAQGVLEVVSPAAIAGWAAREDGGREPVIVELWDGGRLVAAVSADGPRPDVAARGYGDGLGGFRMRTPRELLDGEPHWIWATVSGSGTALRRAPALLRIAGARAQTRDAA